MMKKGGREPQVILHIGMQKTATTFLQWNVFHYLDVNYLWHIFYKPFLKGFLDFRKKVDLKKTKEGPHPVIPRQAACQKVIENVEWAW